MSSKTMVMAPINKAIDKLEEYLGLIGKWEHTNELQKHYIYNLLCRREELRHYSDVELRAWASKIAAELNRILADEGFDIRLDDFGPDECGVVTILDVIVNWIVKGKVDKLTYGGMTYPAVKMKPTAEVDGRNKLIFASQNSSSHAHPIAKIPTESGDVVYMTIADKPLADFELMGRIDNIHQSSMQGGMYDWLKFPMVDLNHETDISWLIGMNTRDKSGDPWIISQAKQQTKFKMNQYGARVKSAVAVSVVKACVSVEEHGLLIDKPFYLWIERPSVITPTVYAYIDVPDWKDPGDLSSM